MTITWHMSYVMPHLHVVVNEEDNKQVLNATTIHCYSWSSL